MLQFKYVLLGVFFALLFLMLLCYLGLLVESGPSRKGKKFKKREKSIYSHSPQSGEDNIVPLQMIAQRGKEINMSKKEFILYRINKISGRTFLIVTKDQLDESFTMWLKSPLAVYGIIFVHGDYYDGLYTETMNISNEVTSNELERLCLLARDSVFNKKL